MRPIRRIVIHHTATPADWTVDRIRREHVEGRGFSDIGYHYIVYPDGSVHPGRPVARPGAHAKGANADSIGIALVGRFDGDRDPPPSEQWVGMLVLCRQLCERYSLTGHDVYGHREVGTTATVCPGFAPEQVRSDLLVGE